ncbi:MAG: 1-acyl-sn-glycerol-3-phosphate acyltransferase [Polyangiaceae bacterium]|nr:1-acyl-sn-glycerol-3-phosphate acyltransferase [Polyangiaceae bacterium]
MSLASLLLIGFEMARVSIVTVADGVMGAPPRERCNRRIDNWSRQLVKHAGIELDVHGLEHAVPGRAYIVMSNHQSHFDIPVVFQALKRPMRMVTKTELFRIPFFGPAMRAAEFVEVDRGNRRQAIEAMERARVMVESGMSIWIAPEGTRSRTGELGEFKRGGFHLALGAQAQILPVSISGTIHVLPARELRLQRGVKVRVTVSPPIDPGDYGRRGLDELIAAVRGIIAAHV